MKAVIIAGGKGERLRPITHTIPKPMVDINGKPILEHIINHFKKHGITEFVISVCYLPEKITEYFGNGEKFGVKIDYIYEVVDKPLGTAGSIAAAKKYVDSPFIITSSDSLRDLNITEMIAYHNKKNGFGTLNIYKRFGVNPKSFVLFDENNQITKFVERPTPDMLTGDFVWSNGFFMIFRPEIFDYIPENTPKDFGKDIFPLLIDLQKPLYAYKTEGYFIDIGDEKKLEKARSTYKP